MGLWDDIGGTVMGGASGAATGGSIGGPWGAAIGGGIGMLGGFLGSHGTSQAADAQRGALDDAMKRLQQFSIQQQQGRAQDLEKTMAFYQPADAYLHSIYAQPPAAPSPTVPKGPRLGLMG